jgi:hypothetical protein
MNILQVNAELSSTRDRRTEYFPQKTHMKGVIMAQIRAVSRPFPRKLSSISLHKLSLRIPQ